MQFMNKKRTYEAGRVFYLPVSQIAPNAAQPRRDFDETAIEELAESIRNFGILQPLTVRRKRGGFELIAGERRLRAAKAAGLREVPCLIVNAEDADSSYLALVENLHRRDLNFMEEAAAISRLIGEYSLSQEAVAEKLGKSQSAVANKLRLLKLSDECVDILLKNDLTERHARALLRLPEEEARLAVLRTVVEKKLNVAQTEQRIEKMLAESCPAPRRNAIIIKDVRLFLNSISHTMDVLRSSGVDASCGREESEDEITLTIHIPKRRRAG